MAEDTNKYSFGEDYGAEDQFKDLEGDSARQNIMAQGRKMAALTIPSIFPPDGYIAGDDLPANNQSINAQAVNSLASALMFMAFPPGQPILKFSPKVNRLQKDINSDPQLYANVILALAELEVVHRERLQATPIASAYVGYIKLLLVAGNALWKHLYLDEPTFHRPDQYVCERNEAGFPLKMILKQCVKLGSLGKKHREQIEHAIPEDIKKDPKQYRDKKVDIYSCCRLEIGETDKDRSWVYWQEAEGVCLEDTEVETDFDNPPMWAGWLNPVYGSNWGTSYCEDFEGDLFSVEQLSSSINDGAALAALALLFVQPGATSIKQIREARNLQVLPGSAQDVSVFRSEKGADLQIVWNNLESIARRVSAAFLMQESIQRSGERVTAEEIRRLGSALDKALGGLYTEIAQGNQRIIITRAIKLHEDEDKDIPTLPPEVFSIKIITGIDALGNSTDFDNLMDYSQAGLKAFPTSFEKSHNASNFFTRLAAAKGVKPDGLVLKPDEIAAQNQAEKAEMAQQTLLDKGAGPLAKGLADSMAGQLGPQAGAGVADPTQPAQGTA